MVDDCAIFEGRGVMTFCCTNDNYTDPYIASLKSFGCCVKLGVKTWGGPVAT
jgi:hypothetical protein